MAVHPTNERDGLGFKRPPRQRELRGTAERSARTRAPLRPAFILLKCPSILLISHSVAQKWNFRPTMMPFFILFFTSGQKQFKRDSKELGAAGAAARLDVKSPHSCISIQKPLTMQPDAQRGSSARPLSSKLNKGIFLEYGGCGDGDVPPLPRKPPARRTRADIAVSALPGTHVSRP